ncbi:hypothetical protein BCE75_1177 [Isoptericola sp. CG 20/1183]|uniref:Uncharacterized protein n=1 Tax=Isoptericola halotolerans TaxID=300560 RepID=A0ABX5E9K4_9MICO|nr:MULTISPECIES: hypothetical protein [Isoptericola]PRZ02737.1 hypothetical protein BCE75_1177 [Isoptericola sp. CG 20/1183]PRZ03183.1 hypothetical protein BCL65_11551 [Isoptericola halotolerans]
MPTTLLAPGQSFVETVLLTGGHETGTLRSLVVRVEYKRSDGDAHIHEYEMTFGEADISGLQRPIVDALTGIEKTLSSWTASGPRSLRVTPTPDPMDELRRRLSE